MNEQIVADIFREAIICALTVASPCLVSALLIGLFVSIFQSVTQINEQTLTFVPKMAGVFLILIIFLPWMIQIQQQFIMNLFSHIPEYIGQ